jgi:hypothetical protein
VLTHFVVSDDVVGSWRFYTEVPGGKTAMEGEPPVAALANNWIIINTRGGLPTTSQASPSRTSRPRTRWPLINPEATAITSKLPSACLAIPEASGKPG